MANKILDIFVICVQQDRNRILPLIQVLEESGMSVFWDSNISIGDKYDGKYDSEALNSLCMIAIWSRNSIGSKWLKDLASIGLKEEKLINVNIDDVDPIYPLNKSNNKLVNLRSWGGEKSSSVVNNLIKTIKSIIDNKTLNLDEVVKKQSNTSFENNSELDREKLDKVIKERPSKVLESTLSKQLKALNVKPSIGTMKVLNLCGALSKARLSETKGIISTRTLIFALAGPSTAYGEILQKYLDDDISLEFSKILVVQENFVDFYTLSFGDITSDWESYDNFQILDKLDTSGNFKIILKEAVNFAEYLGNYDGLEPEHLMAAILNPKHTRAAKYFQKIGITQKQLNNRLSQSLGDIKKGEDLKKWQKVLDKTFKQYVDTANTSRSEEEQKESSAKKELPKIINAHYSSDSPDADDLMDVEDEARSFSRYISKSDLTTPLSIGLFGDWGSGKTFFMHKMQKFVEELQQQGESDREATRSSSWCSNIIQIEFNAWHYIEGNLWASLVDHIFSRMEAWLTKENKRESIDEIYRAFETAQEIKREAEAELDEAKSAKVTAENEHAKAKNDYKAALKKHQDFTAMDIWPAISMQFNKTLEHDADLKMKINIAGEKLGITELSTSTRKLNEVLDQANDVVGRSRIMFASIFLGKRSFIKLSFFLLILILTPLTLAYLINWASTGLEISFFKQVNSGIVETAGLIAVFTAWISKGLNTANKALTALDGAGETLKAVISDKSAEQRKQLAEADVQLNEAGQVVQQAEEVLNQASQAVEVAVQQLKAETPRARLTRFLRERIDNADYANHLGIISMIRKDFDFLSRIMTEKDWTQEDQAKLEEAGIDRNKARTFERIILYVDDLDRCPAERVVEVLQAVHLLLAFPLFVVVVGVDARWVSRALSMSYQHLLGDTVSPDIENSSNVVSDGQSEPKINNNVNNGQESLRISELIASSHDYLEKIFQIPYWVKPMDEQSSKSFIEQLARKSVITVDKKNQKQASENRKQRGDLKEETERFPNQKDDDNYDPEQQGEKVLDMKNKFEQTIKDTNNLEDERSKNKSKSDIVLVDVPLTDFEISFMKSLAPFVGRSPRRAKRFFNVYQLVRAGLTVKEREKFVGDKGESTDYQVLMCLLAIVTGSPILAPQFFSEVVSWDKSGKVKLSILIKNLSNDEVFSKSSEWNRLSGALDTLKSIGHDTDTFKKVRHWTRRAMRFSFTARPV